MKILELIIITTLLVSLGCKKDKIYHEPLKKTTNDESVINWLFDVGYVGLQSNNFIFQNLYIQGYETENNYTFVALDIDSGNVVWKNSDYNNKWMPFNVQGTVLVDNILIASARNKILAIDVTNGKSIWEKNLPGGNSSICVIDGWIYKTDDVNRASSTLHRFNLYTGAQESLFTIKKEDHDGFNPILCVPNQWINPNGDEYLILSNRSYNWITSVRRMDVMAFNLTQDTMVYYREGVDVNSSYVQPAIEENRVYFYGMFDAYCLDAATGETLWNFTTHPEDLEGDFNSSNILIHKDILIVKPDSRWMYGVNKYTGKLIWTNRNTRAMPFKLSLKDGIIWFSSGAVVAVDANTGDKLIDWNYYQGSWIFPVAFHPTKNWIYTSNARYVYCLDPEVMKTQSN